MRWQMDIKETKTVKAGRSKNTILVYEILASSTHTFVQHHHSFCILQGSVNACHSCYDLYRPDKDIQRYCRTCCTWCHIECLEQPLASCGPDIPTQVKDQTSLSDVRLDADFQSILRMPIQRGGDHGIVGNGKDIMGAWKILEAMKILGVDKLPASWKETVSATTFQQLGIHGRYDYYHCTACNGWV